MDVKVIGVDIAKRYFQVHGVGASGMVTIPRKISRAGFLKLLADLPRASSAWRLAPAPIIGHARSRVLATMSD